MLGDKDLALLVELDQFGADARDFAIVPALGGLCQSLARELAPQNIHVAHFVIDGGILQGPDDLRAEKRGPDGMLHPDAIADTYYNIWRQNRSAWTWEVELRPWVENF